MGLKMPNANGIRRKDKPTMSSRETVGFNFQIFIYMYTEIVK